MGKEIHIVLCIIYFNTNLSGSKEAKFLEIHILMIIYTNKMYMAMLFAKSEMFDNGYYQQHRDLIFYENFKN